ncbi:MAG: flagellar export protein FliJ [Pseudomonadota bacterium]
MRQTTEDAQTSQQAYNNELAWNLNLWRQVFDYVQGYRTMKSRDTAMRLKRFEADEKARKVSDLDMMIREFEQMASDLDRQIKAEEERTGVKDRAHFAYSTFAKSAATRRDNLLASADELREKLDAAEKERVDAEEQLQRADNTEAGSTQRGLGRPRTDRPASTVA